MSKNKSEMSKNKSETTIAPGIDIKQSKERARYNFTLEERADLGLEAARAQDEVNALEGELSSLKTDYKGKIEGAENRRNVSMSKQRDGFEMREYQAITVFNEPKMGRKTLYFLDPDSPNKIGPFMREEGMTDSDAQRILKLEAERDEAKGKPAPIANPVIPAQPPLPIK